MSYKYWVVYRYDHGHGHCGNGACEVTLEKPIRSYEDVKLLHKNLIDRSHYNNVMILNWLSYEKEIQPNKTEEIEKLCVTLGNDLSHIRYLVQNSVSEIDKLLVPTTSQDHMTAKIRDILRNLVHAMEEKDE